MPEAETKETPSMGEGATRGFAIAGARFLNVAQGMVMAWSAVLGAVVIGAPRDTPPRQLLGVESLTPAGTSGDSIMLHDLPLGVRMSAWVGVASIILAWAVLLWAAARVARQVATGDMFAPSVASTLRCAALGLVAAAVVLPVMWRITVAQVERWVEEAPDHWGAVTLQTASAPVGTVAGLLIGAAAISILAKAFREGEHLRQETDGLV